MARDLKNPLAKTTEPSFRTAFSTARKSGKKTFNWKSKNYTTKTAEEKASKLKKTNLKKFQSESSKAKTNYYNAIGVESKPKGKNLQKSTKEISDSYDNVGLNGMEGGKKTKYGRGKNKSGLFNLIKKK